MRSADAFCLEARQRTDPLPGGEEVCRWNVATHRIPRDTFISPERRVSVLGTLRTPAGDALDAEALVRRGIVHEGGVRADALTGCGVVVSAERRVPRVHAYATVLGLPPLHFRATDDAFVLATSLRELVARAGPLETDDDALVEHFVFRFVLPPRTCWRGVSRLPGGHLLTWDDGRVTHRRVRRLEPLLAEPFRLVTPAALAWLDGEMTRIATHHAATARRAGRTPATLLSGGVDSVLLALWLGDAAQRHASDDPGDPDSGGGMGGAVPWGSEAGSAPRRRAGGRGPGGRSCAFAVPGAGSFDAETRRARSSARTLATEHLTAEVDAGAYPELLERTVATLARPALFNEAWPCHLALAGAVADGWGSDATLFGGNAADGLHGVADLGSLFPAAGARMDRGSEAAADLAETGGGPDPSDPLRAPDALVSLGAELPLLLECFGEERIREAFDRRRALAEDAAPRSHPWERLQMVDLLSTGCEPSTAVAELYAAYGIEVSMLYRDDEVAAAVGSFHPEVRFVGDDGSGRVRLKPLQHAVLRRRGFGDLAEVPKGGTTFWRDLWGWMGRDDGLLRERVEAIDRPDFMSPELFERVAAEPSDLLWNLLVHDLWRRAPSPTLDDVGGGRSGGSGGGARDGGAEASGSPSEGDEAAGSPRDGGAS